MGEIGMARHSENDNTQRSECWKSLKGERNEQQTGRFSRISCDRAAYVDASTTQVIGSLLLERTGLCDAARTRHIIPTIVVHSPGRVCRWPGGGGWPDDRGCHCETPTPGRVRSARGRETGATEIRATHHLRVSRAISTILPR
jgi:hypothetical protein